MGKVGFESRILAKEKENEDRNEVQLGGYLARDSNFLNVSASSCTKTWDSR